MDLVSFLGCFPNDPRLSSLIIFLSKYYNDDDGNDDDAMVFFSLLEDTSGQIIIC